jgi:hypothetical protein
MIFGAAFAKALGGGSGKAVTRSKAVPTPNFHCFMKITCKSYDVFGAIRFAGVSPQAAIKLFYNSVVT